MFRSLKIISILLFLSSGYLISQETQPDTSIVIRSYSISENSLIVSQDTYDTTIRTIHKYNPVFYQSSSNTFLGNTGQAALTNNIDEREFNTPFLFEIPYKFYIYDPYKIYHFNTRKPYTELKYLTSGSRDDSEQVLSALHTQNINQYSNVGIFYDLIASRGIYLNQNTGLNRLNLFGSYEKDNYSMYTSIHFNGFRFEENGGLLELQSFLDKESEALNYTMNLDDANSRYRNLNLFYTHKLKLPALFSDSARKAKFRGISLQHTINYQRYSKTYEDDISLSDTLNFYENNYYLINQAFDSAFHQNLSNRLDLNIQIAGSQTLKAFLKHEYKSFSYIMPQEITYETDSSVVDTVIRTYPADKYNDISVGGIYTGELKNWGYTAAGKLYLSGYRAGDFSVNGKFTRFFNERRSYISLGGGFFNQRPSYFIENYASAHFIWNNDFNNITNTRAAGEFGLGENFKVKLALNFYTGYIYFNQDAIPEQRGSELLTTTLSVYKKFVWGPVNHSHEILLQKGADDYINVPILAYSNSTWYQNELFKKVLKLQVGFDFYYFTSYFADSFMPATGVFYNQNVSEIGNYPFLDAFINLKLKRTRFTIQYTNALSELLPEANYFMAYRNPNFNATFKFGIAWTFYD